MTNSRKVGPVRVRPHIRNGVATGKWFVDVPAQLSGRGKRIRKLFDSQRQAMEIARELRRRLDPMAAVGQSSRLLSGVTFRGASEGWARDEEDRVATLKKRPYTFEVDCQRLRNVTAFLGELDLSMITKRHLVAYQKWRLDQGRAPATINSELDTFRYVMKWAVEQGYLDGVPKVERVPVRHRRVELPTPREVARVIGVLPVKLATLVRFLAETGCRWGEARNLTWDCVDEINGYVEIRARDGWTPKTQQSERRIPISSGLLHDLRKMSKTGRFVFPGRDPDMPINNMRKSFATAVRAAGVMRDGKPLRLSPQRLRKAHATWQAMRGLDESVLQDLLGHAKGSRVTRQYYVHVQEDAKRRAVLELPMGEQDGNPPAENLAISGNRR